MTYRQNKELLEVYKVIRPYENPYCVIVVAGNKKNAIDHTNKKFGHVNGSKAYRIDRDTPHIEIAFSNKDISI